MITTQIKTKNVLVPIWTRQDKELIKTKHYRLLKKEHFELEKELEEE